jgi:hypothetical protein
MRLSIWNQFSSNHSGSMTIVGTFGTVESTTAAEKILRQIILEVNEWFARPENAQYSKAWMGDPPTPIEVDLIRRYNLPTHDPLGIYQNDIDITTLGNLVQLYFDETRWIYQLYPLKDLLLRLGAEQAAIDHQSEGETIVQAQYHLTCTTPDDTSCLDETKTFVSDLIVLSIDDDEDPEDYFEVTTEGQRMVIHLRLGAPSEEDLKSLYDFLESCGCSNIRFQVEDFPLE